MGSDPKASVLNGWSQAWEVKNPFVTDGGPFASNADKNPTLTIMALAMRSCTWLADELRKGEPWLIHTAMSYETKCNQCSVLSAQCSVFSSRMLRGLCFF